MSLRGLALMAEVVGVLARHKELRVSPQVETDVQEDGLVTVTLTVHPTTADEGLEALSLHDELRYVADVTTVRGIVATYGLAAAPLEAMLRQRDDADAPVSVLALSEAERAALDEVVSAGCALGGWIHQELRPVLLGVRERLLTSEQKERGRDAETDNAG